MASIEPSAPVATGADAGPARLVAYKTAQDQGRERQLRLHVFEPVPSGGAHRAAVLVLHSGGWGHGSPQRYYPMARRLARAGLVACCAEYRLVGANGEDNGNTVFDCVRDARSALRHMRLHADAMGIDAQRIAAAGGSAGGHLAAATGLIDGGEADDPADDCTVSASPQAMLLFNPVIDTSAAGFGHQRLGDRWQELSPLHRVRPGLPPAIIFHGTDDRTTPHLGALRFQEAMHAVGNACDLHSHPGGDHGYYWQEPIFSRTLATCEDFLRRHGILA